MTAHTISANQSLPEVKHEEKKKNEAGLLQPLLTILQPFSGRQRPSIVVVLWGSRVSGAAAPM
ncbi:hypothetical protein QG37_04659 [Candidozyma auris]|nr:hypothetical protein QG37_04659 [[Candida] auris]